MSALGLETVSIPKICVYWNKFRQDSNKCTQEFKKCIGSQRKMLQNMSTDDRQVGGGKPCSFSSTEQPTRKYRLDRKALRERTLFGFFVYYGTELFNNQTRRITGIKFKLVPASYNNMNYIWSHVCENPISFFKKNHPPHPWSISSHPCLSS